MIIRDELGNPALNTIHVADAMKLLGNMPAQSVDCIVTDPPYGLAGRVFEFPHHRYAAINEAWDRVVPIAWMSECRRILKPGGSVICFGVRQSIYQFASEGLRLGWRLVNDITWEKPDAPPCFTGRLLTESTERILWFCPSGENWTYNLSYAKVANRGANLRDVWRFGVERDNRRHPAQKPLALLERIVNLFTKRGDLILDPFVGSGTTALAAKRLGRQYIGCDLSPEYVAIARQRLAQPFTPNMFEQVAPPPMPVAVPLFAGL